MDIREALRTSELWALIAVVVLHTLAFYNVIDPAASAQWEVALGSYAAMRFVSKTAKATVPAPPEVKK